MPVHHRRVTSTALAALVAGGLAAAPALAAPLLVTSTADSGAGSLRAALETAAAASEAQTIVVATDSDIMIETTLSYSGAAPLAVIGSGQIISSANNVTIFAVTQGADLTMSNLGLVGPGGFDIENRGDADGPAVKGLFVDVRDDQEGVVFVSLNSVLVSGVAGHGIHISDCTLADDCGGGSGGAGEGSPASIELALVDVVVEDAAYGRFDADGLRVDERGEGDIIFSAVGSVFAGVGADGVELDEGQAGHVIATVTDSVFEDNGGYCDPEMLAAYMPDVDEAEFEEGAVQEDAIPGPITGSPDDGCFEREVDLYDDGSVEAYEFAIDVDDGFDIDEAGPGDLDVTVIDSLMLNNLDEGFDFDEEDGGDIIAVYLGTEAAENTDDGYKMSEEGDGGVYGTAMYSLAMDNGGVGFVFEEEDGGDVEVVVLYTETSGNDDGELGLEVVQDDDGAGIASVMASDIADGIEAEGITLTSQ